MIDSEKVLIGLKLCTSQSICETCPYYHDCWDDTDSENAVPLMRDALELLKEQDKIIAEYHKADSFLATHGWRWEE